MKCAERSHALAPPQTFVQLHSAREIRVWTPELEQDNSRQWHEIGKSSSHAICIVKYAQNCIRTINQSWLKFSQLY